MTWQIKCLSRIDSFTVPWLRMALYEQSRILSIL